MDVRLCFKIKRKILFVAIWAAINALMLFINEDKLFFILLFLYGYWLSGYVDEPMVSAMVIFLLPMFHVAKSTTLLAYYETAMLISSSIFNGIALQYSGLLDRIILLLLKIIGTTPGKILSVFTVVSTIFSMWIPNLTMVNIMIPVADKVMMSYYKSSNTSIEQVSWVRLGLDKVAKKKTNRFTTALYFGIIFGTTIGGINYVTGSPSNTLFRTVYQHRFRGCLIEPVLWFYISIFGTIILTAFICFWLNMVYLGLFNIDCFGDQEALRELNEVDVDAKFLYLSLGRITWHEIGVGIIYLSIILLWMFRKPLKTLDTEKYTYNFHVFHVFDDFNTLALAMVLLVSIPSDCGMFTHFCRKKARQKDTYGLITWHTLRSNVMWIKIFQYCTCTSLAITQVNEGLSEKLAKYFIFMKNWPMPVVVSALSLSIMVLTEFTSSIVTVSLFFPTLINIGVVLNIHPMLISFPCSLCSSLAFITPFSSSGVDVLKKISGVSIKQAIKIGLLPKVLTWMVINISFLTYGSLFYPYLLTPIHFYPHTDCFCPPCLNITI